MERLKKRVKMGVEHKKKTLTHILCLEITPPIAELICVKNVRVLVVYGFLLK